MDAGGLLYVTDQLRAMAWQHGCQLACGACTPPSWSRGMRYGRRMPEARLVAADPLRHCDVVAGIRVSRHSYAQNDLLGPSWPLVRHWSAGELRDPLWRADKEILREVGRDGPRRASRDSTEGVLEWRAPLPGQ